MTPDPSTPTKRADAERNRAKIVAVARVAFGEADVDVSMAEISRRAGVGMATLYRNFPGRRELLEALYIDEVDAMCADASNLDTAAPGVTFTAWLRRFVAFSTSKRHIASELLTHVDSSNPVFNESRDRVLAAGRPLLVAAQRARQVRRDLTLEQILDMVIAVTSIRNNPAYLKPILQSTIDGLLIGRLEAPAKQRRATEP